MARRSPHPSPVRVALLPATLVLVAMVIGCGSAHLPSSGAQPAPSGAREGQEAVNVVIRRELEIVNAAMTAAFNRGDYLAAARFYTHDAQIIGPGGLRVTGRAAVDQYWTSLPAGATWRLEVLEVGGSIASPWQLGRSTLVMPARSGGGTSTSIVDFIAIWRREPDRSLKLYVDMYVPAPRPAAPR